MAGDEAAEVAALDRVLTRTVLTSDDDLQQVCRVCVAAARPRLPAAAQLSRGGLTSCPCAGGCARPQRTRQTPHHHPWMCWLAAWQHATHSLLRTQPPAPTPHRAFPRHPPRSSWSSCCPRWCRSSPQRSPRRGPRCVRVHAELGAAARGTASAVLPRRPPNHLALVVCRCWSCSTTSTSASRQCQPRSCHSCPWWRCRVTPTRSCAALP